MNSLPKALFAALCVALSACMLGSCSFFNHNSPDEESTYSDTYSDGSSVPTDTSLVSQNDYEPSETAESVTSVQTDGSQTEISSQQSADESSQSLPAAHMTESEAAQVSAEGYEFDDEQIIKDYHNPIEFTDNAAFNDLFHNNAVDAAYIEEQKTASSTRDMINITSAYAKKWKEIAELAYQSLGSSLDDANLQKLNDSQNNWSSGLKDVETSFHDEAQQGGTEALLAAESAIMNYYKGRAAQLLEQIYTLNGSIQLSDFGL